MNALALSALTISSFTGTPATHLDEHEWRTLDREIERLNSIPAEDKSAPQLSAWIKTSYDYSEDFQTAGSDTSGVKFQGIRVTLKGKVGDFELKVSIDGASGGVGGPVTIKDAYARLPLGGDVHAQAGQFKAPFLSTSVESDEKLIFYDRSTQGAIWGGRESGVQLDGQHGPFGWYAAVQNGGDAVAERSLVIGRATLAIVGEPIPMKQSGNFGTQSPTRLQLAAAVADEGTLTDGTVYAGELTLLTGPVYAQLEVLDYGRDFIAGSVTQGNAAKASGLADTTPYGATVGVMLGAKNELAARFEEAEDGNDTQRIWLGYTHYVEGHAVKWQANWIRATSDTAAIEGDIYKVGLTLAL